MLRPQSVCVVTVLGEFTLSKRILFNMNNIWQGCGSELMILFRLNVEIFRRLSLPSLSFMPRPIASQLWMN